MRRYTLIFIAVLCALCSVADAGNFTRPTANATITPVSTQAYHDMLDAFGGNVTPENETAARVNWTAFIVADIGVYSAVMGVMAYVIIFAIPFILMWLMQGDMVPPAVAGILVGGFLLVYLPTEYSLFAGLMVAVAALAVVYALLKERM